MATSLTAQVAESRCRQRVADRTAAIWSATDMMEALDDTLNSIWTAVRKHGRDRLLERLDLAPSLFTTEASQTAAYTYTLPAYAGPIRLVEGMNGNRPVELQQAELDFKGWDMGSAPTWFRSQSGAFTIYGTISKFTSIRVWYHRRWPPMHYGTTSGVGSTTTLLLSSTPTGRIAKRNIYLGCEFEILGGGQEGQVVRATSFEPATLTITFTPTLTAAPGMGIAYSTVVPVDPEHGEYVIEEMASRFLERAGNVNYIAAKDQRLHRLREEFITDLIHRDQAAPPSLFSHR